MKIFVWRFPYEAEEKCFLRESERGTDNPVQRKFCDQFQFFRIKKNSSLGCTAAAEQEIPYYASNGRQNSTAF